jgi:predicted dehydrogenase
MAHVRVAVIGIGSVAEKYIPHLRRLAIEGWPNQIVLACDANPGRRDLALNHYGIPDFTTDWQAVLARPDVDAVLVLTAMQAHGTITRAALQAGKHVLVEKPMSMDLTEAAGIVAMARTAPGILVCAPHVTLSRTYQDMWRAIDRGAIGRPLSARGLYGWSGPTWGPWFYEPGGGPMFDLGVYNVTTLTGLLGPARRVMAMTGTAIPERIVDNRKVTVRTEDNFQLLIDFGDQCFATVTTGFTLQRYRAPGIEIYGTKGTIQMMGEDWDPQGYELWENDVGHWAVHDDRAHWPWTDGVRDFIAAIHEGRGPINSPEHAYHVLEIMIRCAESGRTGQALPIQSTFTPPRFDTDKTRLAPHLDHAPS